MNDNDSRDHEQKVRERAYALWEEEGRPEGREHDHWHRADRELGGDGSGGFADSQNGAVNTGAPSGTHQSGRVGAGGIEDQPAGAQGQS